MRSCYRSHSLWRLDAQADCRKTVSAIRRRSSGFMGCTAYHAPRTWRTCFCKMVYIQGIDRCREAVIRMQERWLTDGWATALLSTVVVCSNEVVVAGGIDEELFNLLINPLSHDFALRWHRDDIKEDATEEEEQEALKVWHHGVCTSSYCSFSSIEWLLKYISCQVQWNTYVVTCQSANTSHAYLVYAVRYTRTNAYLLCQNHMQPLGLQNRGLTPWHWNPPPTHLICLDPSRSHCNV